MAELPPSTKQVLEKLEEQLTCGICLQPYADPKLLQCFHVFCEKCLQPLAKSSPQGQAISCPNCRHVTPLPQNGVPGLQGAFLIHHLFDIQHTLQKVSAPTETMCDTCKKREPSCYCRTCEFICDKCKGFHSEWEKFSSHKIISLDQLTGDVTNLIPPVKKTPQCSKHPDKQLDIYCESCEELICHDCIVRVHRDHKYDLVRDAFPKHKDVIIASLQPVEQQLATVCKALEGLEARSNQITNQCQVIETQIQRSIQQFHKALEARKEDLITQLGQITGQKLKTLAAQRDQLELVATRLKSCRDFVQETLRTGSEGEILTMKKPVLEQIKEMDADLKLESLVPEEQANMEFTYNQTEVTQACICQQFGQVYVPTVSPAKCHTTGSGTKVAMVGEQTTATLHAMDQEGREYSDPVEVTCELVSNDGSSQVRGEVKRNEESKYEISYCPQHRGQHQLHIRVQGTHISGSPFTVAVLTTTPTSTIRGLKGPWGVAVNDGRQIIVAESSRHCISIFSTNGNKVRSFGRPGSAPGQLKGPVGVAITATRDILVGDHRNHRIQLFSPEGRSLKCIGTAGNGPLQFQYPKGIAIHPHSNKIFIADESNHRIQILNPDFTFCSSFGSEGTGNAELKYPFDISFDSTGNVFVSEWGNHRIQVFSENGVYIRQFGKKGSGDGELKYPTAMAIGSNDVVYICDRDNHRVSLFTFDGHFLKSFGTELGQFERPYGLAIDKDGIVFVSDYIKNHVQLFV